MWLRGDRTVVLSALALAMGGREALPEALERLSGSDPALAVWAGRLAPALRAGQPLPELLRRWRLVDADAALRLDHSDRPADLLAGLADEAAARARLAWRLHLMRWYPAWLVTLLAGCALLASCTVGAAMAAHYREIGMKLPQITVLVVEADPPTLVALVAGVWLGCWILARVPAVRHVLHLTAPEVHHAAAWWRLVRAARSGSLACPSSWWSAHSPQRDWSTWWLLARWRFPRGQRHQLMVLPLPQRMERLGVPVASAQGWEEAEAEAWGQLERAMGVAWGLINFRTLAVVVGGLIVIGYILPLFSSR